MPPVPDISDSILPREEKSLFLMGGYTDKSVLAHNPKGSHGEGFYSVVFDPEDGKFQRLESNKIETNPAFIMKHPELDVVYMTTEVISEGGSELLVGNLNRKDGSVEIVDRKRVHGKSTCHVSWDKERNHVVAVSYWDCRLTTFSVDSQGGLSDAVEVYTDPGAEYVDKNMPDRWEHLAHRQRWPHLHQVNLDPYSRKFFLVPDLGRDMIHFFNIQDGHISRLGGQQLRLGPGPRHLEFGKQNQVVYVCGELDNSVTVLKYNKEAVERVVQGGYSDHVDNEDKSKSLLTFVQTISSVPDALDTKSTIAEMRLHPSGRFLYVGNRGHNSIAVYRTDQDTGTLTLVDIQSSHGAFPRHFNFDVSSRFLVVGNHCSDNIVAFRILETGKLEMVDVMENVPSIVWLTPVVSQ